MPRRNAAQIAADAERERIEAEAEVIAPQAEADEEMTEEHGDNVIVRQTEMSWWCPLCGNSQTKLIDTCGGCGAQRDGDTVST